MAILEDDQPKHFWPSILRCHFSPNWDPHNLKPLRASTVLFFGFYNTKWNQSMNQQAMNNFGFPFLYDQLLSVDPGEIVQKILELTLNFIWIIGLLDTLFLLQVLYSE